MGKGCIDSGLCRIDTSQLLLATHNHYFIYCGSGNFRVFRFSQICDFGTLHEVQNSRIINLMIGSAIIIVISRDY